MLDKHFRCPKWLKVATLGQTREQRLSMFEAYQSYINWKKRSLKRTQADKAEVAHA